MKSSMIKIAVCLSIFFDSMFLKSYSQNGGNVGIGTNIPDNSAILELKATDKGLLIPRLTTQQRVAITNPANGLFVYDVNYKQFWYFNGVQWVQAIGPMGMTGSTGATGATGAIGATGPTGPLVPGTFGQTLRHDGTSWIANSFLYNSGTNIGINTSTPSSTFQVNQGSVMFWGDVGGTPYTGSGTRFMWIPTKHSLRAGTINGSQWDNQNIGLCSAAFGYSNTASGANSTAVGSNNIASGISSFVAGDNSKATGDYSIVAGRWSTANNDYCLALGTATLASGYNSTAIGNNTKATGENSIAMGNESVASYVNSVSIGFKNTSSGKFAIAMSNESSSTGFCSVAIGNHNTARGESSVAAGSYSLSTGFSSVCLGTYTVARTSHSLVLGKWNVSVGDSVYWVATDPVFTIGNGYNDLNRHNALNFIKNGDLYISGNYYQSSDKNIKKDIVPLENALSRIQKITPVYFYYIDNKLHPEGRHIGLIAQEVQEQFPELVKESGNGYLSVDYSAFSAVLLKAVKEQNDIIEKQSYEINKISNELNILKDILGMVR